MIRLAGGVLKLLESAEIAYEENDAQWALHCAQAILRFTSSELFDLNEINDSTLVSRARQLMLASLRSLASREVSANGRNYYLTYAREVEGKLVVKPGPKQVHEVVKQLGAVEILKLLPLRLRSELCEEVTMKVRFSLSSPLALIHPFLSIRLLIDSLISSEQSPSLSPVAWLMLRRSLTPPPVTWATFSVWSSWSQWMLRCLKESLRMKETKLVPFSLVIWWCLERDCPAHWH
jgi:hypothetical protein